MPESDADLKVSAKGGVSLYGVRRFPITFYPEEWNRILDMRDEIRAFLREHACEPTRKGKDRRARRALSAAAEPRAATPDAAARPASPDRKPRPEAQSSGPAGSGTITVDMM